jgi:hypothetical protein
VASPPPSCGRIVGYGKEPLIEYFEKMHKEYEEKTIEFV